MRVALRSVLATIAVAALVALALHGGCVTAVLVPVGSGGVGGSSASGGVGGAGGTGPAVGGGGAGGNRPCSCQEIDVLLVIDNSDSIDEYAIELALTFQAVSGNLLSLALRACSFHFGVVTSRAQPDNPSGCDVLGALSRVNSSGTSCPVANGIYATEADNFATAIACLASPGTQGNGGERPIDAMFAALDPQIIASGACNDGFFRPSAPLLAIIISDIDDTVSANDPAQWFADLVALNGGDSSRVASLGVLGPLAVPTPMCNAGVCTRLHGFLLEHDVANQAATNICNVSTTDLQQAIDRMADALCPLPSG